MTAPLGWPLPSVSSNSAHAKMSSSSSSFSSLRVALPSSVTHLWAGVTPGSPISLPHTRARSLYLRCSQITFSPLASCLSSVPAPAPFPVTPSFCQLAPSVLFLKLQIGSCHVPACCHVPHCPPDKVPFLPVAREACLWFDSCSPR